MKLEVGKSYRTAAGEKATVVRVDAYGDFVVRHITSFFILDHNEDGTCYGLHTCDLVSEWVDEPTSEGPPQTLDDMGAKVGDIVEFVKSGACHKIERIEGGRYYTGEEGAGILRTDAVWLMVSRAPKAPTIWRDMTADEKVALYEARSAGKTVQLRLPPYGGWTDCVKGSKFVDEFAFRIKPEPKRERVRMWACGYGGNHRARGFTTSELRDSFDRRKYEITFDLVDGVPDCASVKMEKI